MRVGPTYGQSLQALDRQHLQRQQQTQLDQYGIRLKRVNELKELMNVAHTQGNVAEAERLQALISTYKI